jgi:hypothetical protein
LKEYIELGKEILLIKNAVSNPNKLYEIIKKSKTEKVDFFSSWVNWKPWGYYSKVYPVEDTSWMHSDSDGAYFIKETTDSFWDAIKYYKENLWDSNYVDSFADSKTVPSNFEEFFDNKKNIVGWQYPDLLIAESLNTNPTKFLSMDYHLDKRRWITPSPQIFNYNIYINDDYEGGEIQFIDIENAEKTSYINQVGDEKTCYYVDDPITYKMEAGDGLLFRTDIPHAVFPIKGKKYYVRHFLSAPIPQEWTDMESSLSDEDFMKKIAEIEKDGFLNKEWRGMLFATKETIDEQRILKKDTNIYVLKSGNHDLISKQNRFTFSDDDEQPFPIEEFVDLYVYNRKDHCD